MLGPKARHQRGDVAAAKSSGCGDAQMACRLDAAFRHAGLGIGHIGQQALAVFQKRAALVREADAAGGAHQELHAQVLFERIQPTAHDGGRHALGLGGCSEAAARGHRYKGFEGLEFVHGR
ncbi:hypothetical protein D3C71_1820710 [compost metagenome]